MAKLILVPALAVGLGAFFYLKRHRHHDEVPEDKPMYPAETPGGGTMMEAGIE
jgi:hypothetical protein